MKILDGQHRFFRPLWRRVVVTAVCGGWTAVELWFGNTFWGAVFAVMTALCVWEFFVVFERKGGGGQK